MNRYRDRRANFCEYQPILTDTQDYSESAVIEIGARINHPDGYNPLHKAAYRGNAGLVSALLNHGAVIDLIDQSDRPALHMAVVGNHKDVVELLLDSGANPESHGSDGLTAIDRATLEDLPVMMNYLRQRGAKSTILSAIRRGDMAAVKTFARERPGLIHGEPALDGATLLHHAARFGQLNICKYLIGEGSDLAARDAGGYTPTHRACQQKNANVLRAVCTKAVVNLQGNYGETPLHFCAEDGNTEFGRILISEFNSDLNKFDWFGKTPLLVACYMERREFSKLLIENNADVNVQDKKKGNTALHYALDYPCDLVLADLLLKNGADPFIRNDNGKTSVDRAQTNEECKRLFAKFIKKR